MKNYKINMLSLAFVAASAFGCNTSKNTEIPPTEVEELEENAPLPGFDVAGSDADAVMIADKVMRAMGGRKAWDETRYLRWDFFGRRTLLWDKYTGDVRIEFAGSDEKIIVNINTQQGQVFKDGAVMSNADSLASYLKKGKSIWINDAYWLVMPYKLKDSGVSLFYIGSDTTAIGAESYVLQLAFKNVGDTPNNVYHVWVDVETDLVTQWAYYSQAENPEPSFITPWSAYKKHGNILLSGDRGVRQITDISVMSEVPETSFNSFEAINFEN